ncbi:coiled-coil domain-containing protein 192-like [Argopecten irradians]|uniref:coiled-coil domain-containing protein 192-like n=1 Tax=Argopecten irradians TaxID=31199 RepID=UPI003720D540
MGSGGSKSSQVQAVHFEPERDESDSRPSSGNIKRTQSRNSKSESGAAKNIDSEIQVAQKKILELEKQLAETESENLDLQDRVQGLECQLDEASKLQTVHEVDEPQDLTETLKAKDLLIANEEKEKKALQTEFTKMKNRYRKRIKTLMNQVAEAKQEQSIQMFELRDEITRLREENKKAREKSSSATSNVSSEELQGSNKMMIVLELSNQLSEQASTISKLERENDEKQLIIDKLLKESKNGAKTKYFSEISMEELEKDKKVEERNSLRKLSSGLGQYKKPPLSGGLDRKQENDVDEERNCSGTSRDSGLGSAGRNGRNPPKLTRGSSKLSTLSDSDWESDEPLSVHSKIRSAPADVQAKRTASRCSTISTKTVDDDAVSLDDNASVSSTTKKSKKMSYLQRRFRPDIGHGDTTRSPLPAMNAFESESVSENNHFFLTQSDSLSESDPMMVY